MRSFWYELINQGADRGQESNFGLLGPDFPLKPSGRAVRNLTALFGEARYNGRTRRWEPPDPAFKPGALDYTLSGETANVHSTLLQKANGKFYLCLWQEVASCDHDNAVEADIAVAPAPVSLRLSTPVASATLYSPTTSTSPVPLVIVRNKIALGVPDEVVVIELTPPARKVAPKRKAAPDAAGRRP